MTHRITKQHLAYQLEIFAGYVGKETRDQLVERVKEQIITWNQGHEYWQDPEYLDNILGALDIGEYNGVYKITNGDGYFSGNYGHAATSKRAIYEVLCMVNAVLRDQVELGNIEDYRAMKGNR